MTARRAHAGLVIGALAWLGMPAAAWAQPAPDQPPVVVPPPPVVPAPPPDAAPSTPVPDAAPAAPAPAPDAATGSGAGSGSGSGSATAPVIIDAPFVIGQPEVIGSAAPAEVRIGDPFTLYVTAVYGADVTVNLPSTLALGGVIEEMPGRSARDSKRTDGKLMREWQVPLRAWTVGEIALPPVPVTFVAPAGAGQVMTAPIPIKVIATVADADDPTQLRGDAPPRQLKRRDWTLVIIGAVIVGAIALLAFGYWLWKRSKRRRRPRVIARDAPAPSQSLLRSLDGPAAAALRELAKIEASGALDDTPTDAIERMVAVMRTYVGRRGGFSPADLTTAELERELARRGAVDAALRPRLHAWLGIGDRVKYAGVPPDAHEARAALTEARSLVLEAAGVEISDGDAGASASRLLAQTDARAAGSDGADA